MDRDLANHLALRLRDCVKAVRETAIVVREEVDLDDREYVSTLPRQLPDRGFVAPLEVINAALDQTPVDRPQQKAS